MQTITWDIESNNLLNSETVDYNASPYILKPSFAMHCIVVEVHGSGDIVAFYDGDKYILDGRRYEESDDLYEYVLEDYKALEYEHKQLSEFPDFIKNNGIKKAIAHNGINFDWLATKLYYGMDYTIEEDTYKGLPVGNDSWHGKPMELVDTMVMSKTLHPDRFGGHTLDKLSESVGFRKIDFRPHIKNKSHKFKTFAADMLYYCIIDTQATTKVHAKLVKEWGDWDWNDAMKLEKKVAEIVTRQEHRGFSFDSKLAEQNIEDLDRLMQECIDRVGDALPPKPAGKGFMKDYTPPKEQFLKSGKPNAFIKRFADKHDGVIDETGEGVYEITILGETHKLPLPQEPLITEVPATLKDSSHIKEWLVGAFRWIPSEFNERDLSVKQAKGKPKRTQEEFEKAVNAYVDQTLNSPLCKLRCELLEVSPSQLKKKLLGTQSGRPCKVPTNPKYTRGQDKEICPNLEELQKQFPHARDAVNYLTYQHRRNSILGGGAEWDEDVEPEKGFMSQVREDGRIGTPADTQGAGTTRFTHRGVANIPRITSLFGSQMRGLFGSGEGCYQIGYDFDALEAKVEAHYCWRYDAEDKAYCNSLTLPKPNDCHTVLAKSISEVLGEAFKRASAKQTKYACLPTDSTEVLTENGWKRHDEIGDLKVYGLDPATGETVLTDVSKKWLFKDADTYKFGNSKWNVECTSDHRWYGQKGLKKYSTCHDGFYTAEDASTSFTVITSSKCTEKGDENIKPHQAAFVGWLLSDGYYKFSGFSRNVIQGLKMNIGQAEGSYIEEVRECLKVNSLRYTESFNGISGDNNVNKTFTIKPGDGRNFLKEVVGSDLNKHEVDWVSWVLRLTPEARKEFLHAFWLADGCTTINDGRLVYRQNRGNIADAVVVCGQLSGYKVTQRGGKCSTITMNPNCSVGLQTKILKEERKTDVFCLTTGTGTFIIRQGGVITVTGNCSYNAQPKRVARSLGSSLEMGQIVFDTFWEKAYPLKELKERMQKYWETTGCKKFLLGIDGRKLGIRSKGNVINTAFQSAGVICAKRAMVLHDQMLRKEGFIVDFFTQDWKNESFCQQMIAYHK